MHRAWSVRLMPWTVLVPVGKQVQVKTMIGPQGAMDHPDIILDPSTMLIQAES